MTQYLAFIIVNTLPSTRIIIIMRSYRVLTWLSLTIGTLGHGLLGSSQRRSVNDASSTGQLGTFLHNRISPNYSRLYIAEEDGSNE